MPVRYPQDRPVYRLAEPFFDPQDNYHPADKVVVFAGTPNASMIPLNELAREKYDEYMDLLDEGLKQVCAEEKRPFTPHDRVYDEVEEELEDISPGAPRKPGEKLIKLGARRKVGVGAESL